MYSILSQTLIKDIIRRNYDISFKLLFINLFVKDIVKTVVFIQFYNLCNLVKESVDQQVQSKLPACSEGFRKEVVL